MQICICRDRVEYVKLKEICMPKQWKTIASSMLKDSGYPVYGANGIIGYYSDYNHDKETILVTCRGATCGTVNICKPFSYINGNAMALDNLDGKIDIKYLYYYLKKRGFDDVISGSAQPQITRTSIEKIEIPTCEISKQKMLVNLFDKIELLINDQKRQLQLLDELVRARFVEMFGDPIENQKDWEVVKIRDIVTDVRYGTSKPAVEGGRYPYLRMNNLTVDGGLDLSDLKYIDIPDNEIEKCVVRKGDILFNRTNSIDLIGKTAVYNLLDDMVIAGYIIRIRLNNQILPDVFSQYMNLEAMKKVLRGMAKGAVNQANINAQELQSIKVYIPNMELQKQYVEFKEEIDKSRLLSKHSLSLIKFITF